MAHDLAETCLEAQIAVPDQVAIIGVNNDEFLCESAWPPLSSVSADFVRVGYAAAKMLDRLLQGETLKDEQREHLLPPLGVVQRQSTSMLAVKDPDLATAIWFIREHACDPCSVADVLSFVPVGRRWLERQFVANIGRSPHHEILRVRVDTARRLLSEPDLSMQDVASRSGFREMKSFYRAFQMIAGSTPAKFRKKLIRTDATHRA